MSIFTENGKDLWMYLGDTGNIIFSGLPTDKIYTCYFSVFDEDNDRIVAEITATSFDQTTGVATFVVNEEKSKLLRVGDYTYALKICAGGAEDTVIPETKLVDGNYVAQSAPKFTVKPQRTEGA